MGMYHKYFRKIYHPDCKTLDIPITPNFSKEVGQLTDKQAYGKMELVLSILGRKPTNTQTDIQDISNYLKIVYKHSRNVPMMLRKISHSEPDINPLSAIVQFQ